MVIFVKPCYAGGMNTRIVMHLDMDAFFASVEIVKNPALKGKPVVVGGNPDGRGVVSTASYEARKFGVYSSLSLYEARKRCPDAIFLEGDFASYRAYSEQVIAIMESFTQHIEVVGIDEAYLDVSETAPHFGGALKLAKLLREEIFKQTSLPCSVGIGANKLIAKIASGLAKPNGLYDIPAGQEAAFLAPLPIQTLPGVGTKTQAALNREGLKTVADLQALGMDTLIDRYGAYGYYFYLACHGRDQRPVESEHQPPKSIGAETTFDVDQEDREVLIEALSELFEKAYKRLRRHRMRARGVSLKLRFSDFHTITRSRTFQSHTNEREFLYSQLIDFFNAIHNVSVPLRLIGLSFEKLTDGYWQPSLWE